MQFFGATRSRTLSIVITCLLVCAVAFTGWTLARVQQAAANLQEEMVVAADAMLSSLSEGDFVALECASMRLWRLAGINQQLSPLQPYARSLQAMANDLTGIAAGWHSIPLPAEQRQGVRLQLINLREMIKARDLSKANAILAWLQTP